MKRFYKNVTCEEKPEGYAILLDGRMVKSKSALPLYAPNKEIAEKIVEEWAAQDQEIDPETMPFTQILGTRIDRVSTSREAMSSAIFKYLDTDLICYLADIPAELRELQEQNWKHWREWMEERFGYYMASTTGLNALKQDDKLRDAVIAHIESLSDDLFTILQVVTPLTGSLILGLALTEGQASADDVFKACFVEEHYKDGFYMVDEYGRDPLSDYKQKSSLRDLKACETYRSLLT